MRFRGMVREKLTWLELVQDLVHVSGSEHYTAEVLINLL